MMGPINDGCKQLQVHYGGTFKGDDKYIGGKFEVFDDYVMDELAFGELEICVKRFGYHSILKCALRDPNETEKYHFFHDEDSLLDTFNSRRDFQAACVKVYIECLTADLTEPHIENVIDIWNDIDVGNYTEKNMGYENDRIVDELGEKFVYESDIIEYEDLSEDDEELIELIQKKIDDNNDETTAEGSEYEESGESDTSQVSHNSNEDTDFLIHKKIKRAQDYDKNCDHTTLKYEIGMRFKDCVQWAIVNGYNIKWKKSGGHKLEAVCEDGCPWRIYASKLGGEPTCVIKTYVSEHKCLRVIRNRQATSEWLANVILPTLKRNPRYGAEEMIKDVQITYGTIVNKEMCKRARNRARQLLRGTYESHYSKLRSYITYLRMMDKTGRFELKTYLDNRDRPVFQRVYIGFSALKCGFMVGCRRAIGFDACFLKTVLGGTLLAGVTKDCNNKMYPIAWAVVEKENEDTWTWFFNILFEELNIGDGFGWTFMSDKQKGLINGIANLTPNAEHRHCARHIYANWKKSFRGTKYRDLFWEAVKSTNETQFKIKTCVLKAESILAYEGFFSRQPQAFCKSLISMHTKTDIIDNNICEAFNSYILSFRDKPLIDMLEDIRLHLMCRQHDIAKTLQSSVDILCPNIRKKLEKIQSLVRFTTVKPAVGLLYEVHMDSENYIVNLGGRECTCRWWMLTGIPCCHALACITHIRDDPVNYIDVFYHRSNCIETYRHALTPMDGPDEWPIINEPPILPPKALKPPGRPRKNRKRDPTEELKGKNRLPKTRVRMSCHKCGGFGHNTRTCKFEGPCEQPQRERIKKRRSSEGSSEQHQPQGETRRSKTSGKTPTQRAVEHNEQGPIKLQGETRRSKTSGKTPTQRAVERNERRLTRQGYGIRSFGESGNVYIRPPGARRVSLIHHPQAIKNTMRQAQVQESIQKSKESSQRSQLDDGCTPPPT